MTRKTDSRLKIVGTEYSIGEKATSPYSAEDKRTRWVAPLYEIIGDEEYLAGFAVWWGSPRGNPDEVSLEGAQMYNWDIVHPKPYVVEHKGRKTTVYSFEGAVGAADEYANRLIFGNRRFHDYHITTVDADTRGKQWVKGYAFGFADSHLEYFLVYAQNQENKEVGA